MGNVREAGRPFRDARPSDCLVTHDRRGGPLEIAVEASNTALSCSSSFAYSFVIALRSRLISACISENRSTMISTR